MKSFFVVVRRGHHIAYGPFSSDRDAAEAGYFYKAVEARDVAAKDSYKTTPKAFLLSGVNSYDANELEALARTPTEFGCKSFKVLPPKKLPIHPSWSKLCPHDNGDRERIRDKDFEAWW